MRRSQHELRDRTMRLARKLGDYAGTDMREGQLTKIIESQTSKVPSGTYLSIGIGAMAASLLLLLVGQRNVANFVGQWVPTILIMGLYNKLVKVQGSE
jgi:hypothetical protein